MATFLLVARLASAQQSNEASAQALFERGRDLYRAGKAEQGCPLLAESERLDPATGTLLALALCHEAEGKLASAWAEFADAETQSRSAGRADRVQVAQTHAKAVKRRLSTLEVRVPAELAAVRGLEIRRDDVLLGDGAWNVAVPVDGGEYVVAVSAPGKVEWKMTVSVKKQSDIAVLEAPRTLQASPTRAAVAAEPVATPPQGARPELPPEPDAKGKGWNSLEWAGVATASAGVVGLGLGGYFLAGALGKKSDSKQDCTGNVCGVQGTAQRNSAIDRGNLATVFSIAGGALFAGGVTLFIVGRSQRTHAEDQSAAGDAKRDRPSLALGADSAGVTARFSASF